MAFRTPTLLKSTDLQCGQLMENMAYCNLTLGVVASGWQGSALPRGKKIECAPRSQQDNKNCADRSCLPSCRFLAQFTFSEPRAPILFVDCWLVFCCYRHGGIQYRRTSISDSSTQIIASVVSIREAMEAAFCRAVRVTFAGSMTPAFTKSSYWLVAALKPKFVSC